MTNPSSPYRFHWKVSGMGETEWEVWGDGPMYRIEARYDAGEYFRSIYNGSSEEYDREVVASVGILRLCHSTEIMKKAVFDAFIASEKDAHERCCELHRKTVKERYNEEVLQVTLDDWAKREQWYASLRRGHYELLTHSWMSYVEDPVLPRYRCRWIARREEMIGTGNECWSWVCGKCGDYDATAALKRGDFVMEPLEPAKPVQVSLLEMVSRIA